MGLIRLLGSRGLLCGCVVLGDIGLRRRRFERGQHGMQFGQVARHTSKLTRQRVELGGKPADDGLVLFGHESIVAAAGRHRMSSTTQPVWGVPAT